MKQLILLFVTTTLCLVGVNAQDVLTTDEMNSVFKKEKHHNKRIYEKKQKRGQCLLGEQKCSFSDA